MKITEEEVRAILRQAVEAGFGDKVADPDFKLVDESDKRLRNEYVNIAEDLRPAVKEICDEYEVPFGIETGWRFSLDCNEAAIIQPLLYLRGKW